VPIGDYQQKIMSSPISAEMAEKKDRLAAVSPKSEQVF
jgi:hypothetical protein